MPVYACFEINQVNKEHQLCEAVFSLGTQPVSGMQLKPNICKDLFLNAKYGLPGHRPLLLYLFIRLRTSQLHAVCTLVASGLRELCLISKCTVTWVLRLLSLKMQECLAQQIQMLEPCWILKADL